MTVHTQLLNILSQSCVFRIKCPSCVSAIKCAGPICPSMQFFHGHTHWYCHVKLCTHTLWATNSSSPWYASIRFAVSFPINSPRQTALCSPAWWGFANAGDRNRLEGFLRRAQKAGYYNNDSLPTVAAHCDQADEQLFSSLKYCQIHPLRQYLPPERKTPYGTRSRPHNYCLPQKLTILDECNYMFRVLYKHCF